MKTRTPRRVWQPAKPDKSTRVPREELLLAEELAEIIRTAPVLVRRAERRGELTLPTRLKDFVRP